MARLSPATQAIVRTGLAPALTAPNGDGDIIDTGRVFLEVANGGGSPITVTVVSTAEVDGLPVEDLEVSVPAAGRRLIGPFAKTTFGQPAGDANVGKAFVNYSGTTSVTRGVFAL
ncbi:hypothetical protein [Amycolatopsis sp. 195334CR]|uniref:hypothetical protein n=1 Tax=Amycolatopsis sp. 195334CR TaxID=2814588 RepID=UPI001A8E5FDD|nr:hypothetical protein [Amycolatopsis sp. 195334CR]MBN6037476.1 hypothetical protein [Amycolatopsis sp. 195334CR]